MMELSALPVTQLILVRHGQSLYNREGASVGTNTGLTELGWHQAQLVADWLARHYRADVLLSSTLLRAQQTAEVIAQRLSLPLALLPGAEEAEQPYWNELQAASADPLAYWDTFWQPTPDRSPAYCAFRDQVREALARVMAEHAGKTIILVSHGGTIGTLLRSLFGGHNVILFTENTGITHLVWKEGRWRLVTQNAQAHLAPLNRSAADEAALQPASPFPWAEGTQLQTVVDQFQPRGERLPFAARRARRARDPGVGDADAAAGPRAAPRRGDRRGRGGAGVCAARRGRDRHGRLAHDAGTR